MAIRHEITEFVSGLPVIRSSMGRMKTYSVVETEEALFKFNKFHPATLRSSIDTSNVLYFLFFFFQMSSVLKSPGRSWYKELRGTAVARVASVVAIETQYADV